MDISVIVPVYNAEKYLSRCVDSLILTIKNYHNSEGVMSSHENCEILLIDNNSTDNSIQIEKKYQKENPKIIKVLQCNTPGAAAVRNLGVKSANGKYIWFVDADDEVTPDAISKLLTIAQKSNADLVMMGAARIYADGHTDYLSAVNAKSENYQSRFVRYGMGPWQVLIRRAWWVQNGFSFHEGIIHEDMELMSALILNTQKYTSVDEPLYLYYQNDNSVLHQKKFDAHIFDIFSALEGLYHRFLKANAVLQYHDELE